jgi:transposase
MSNAIIAVDLAKNVFEIAVAGKAGSIQERKRLTRAQFERFWSTRVPCVVVMEACSTAHFWARFLIARGFEPRLIPPHYVTPYRRRNKTDRTDCEALLEADRCGGIHAVTVKSEQQQAIMTLHRVRAQWQETRTARINLMRGMLREFGVTAPTGSRTFMTNLHQLLRDHQDRIPAPVRHRIGVLWEEGRDLESRIDNVTDELGAVAASEPTLQALTTIPGIGVLTATALFGSIPNIHSFKNGRQLACWLGLTPRESSSGSRRRLGRISKQGDAYLRTLLIHGARSALNAAQRAQRADRPMTQLQAWSLERAHQMNHNKAAVALANKLARIVWAVWHYERAFDGDHVLRNAA